MRSVALLLTLLWASAVWALDPSEMLSDPVLEARARALDHQLRCVKCQSESIASSNAEWAQDARRAVRERIAAGDSDADVIAWFRERYGDFVMMNPSREGANVLLWLAGPAMLVLAGGIGMTFVRRRRALPEAGLTPEEEARIADLLKD